MSIQTLKENSQYSQYICLADDCTKTMLWNSSKLSLSMGSCIE